MQPQQISRGVANQYGVPARPRHLPGAATRISSTALPVSPSQQSPSVYGTPYAPQMPVSTAVSTPNTSYLSHGVVSNASTAAVYPAGTVSYSPSSALTTPATTGFTPGTVVPGAETTLPGVPTYLNNKTPVYPGVTGYPPGMTLFTNASGYPPGAVGSTPTTSTLPSASTYEPASPAYVYPAATGYPLNASTSALPNFSPQNLTTSSSSYLPAYAPSTASPNPSTLGNARLFATNASSATAKFTVILSVTADACAVSYNFYSATSGALYPPGSDALHVVQPGQTRTITEGLVLSGAPWSFVVTQLQSAQPQTHVWDLSGVRSPFEVSIDRTFCLSGAPPLAGQPNRASGTNVRAPLRRAYPYISPHSLVIVPVNASNAICARGGLHVRSSTGANVYFCS